MTGQLTPVSTRALFQSGSAGRSGRRALWRVFSARTSWTGLSQTPCERERRRAPGEVRYQPGSRGRLRAAQTGAPDVKLCPGVAVRRYSVCVCVVVQALLSPLAEGFSAVSPGFFFLSIRGD